MVSAKVNSGRFHENIRSHITVYVLLSSVQYFTAPTPVHNLDFNDLGLGCLTPCESTSNSAWEPHEASES